MCQAMEGCSRCTHYTHAHTAHTHVSICMHARRQRDTHTLTLSLSLAQEKEGSSRAPIDYHAMVAEKEEQKKTKDIQVPRNSQASQCPSAFTL